MRANGRFTSSGQDFTLCVHEIAAFGKATRSSPTATRRSGGSIDSEFVTWLAQQPPGLKDLPSQLADIKRD